MKERTSSEHPATMDTMDTVHLYEFAVIRYLPRVEREEFINIGIIMMCKRRKWIRVKLRVDERKLEAFGTPDQPDISPSFRWRNVSDGSPPRKAPVLPHPVRTLE